MSPKINNKINKNYLFFPNLAHWSALPLSSITSGGGGGPNIFS